MDREQGDPIYGVVVGVLYVLVIGAQAFFIVDGLTHGALTDDVRRRWRRARARLEQRRRLDRAVDEATPWLRWEIHQLEHGETA